MYVVVEHTDGAIKTFGFSRSRRRDMRQCARNQKRLHPDARVRLLTLRQVALLVVGTDFSPERRRRVLTPSPAPDYQI